MTEAIRHINGWHLPLLLWVPVHSYMVSGALLTHAGFGMYFLLFGLAAIFLFAGANVLPTSRNNRNYIEKQLADSIRAMEDYIKDYPGFSGDCALCASDRVGKDADDS